MFNWNVARIALILGWLSPVTHAGAAPVSLFFPSDHASANRDGSTRYRLNPDIYSAGGVNQTGEVLLLHLTRGRQTSLTVRNHEVEAGRISILTGRAGNAPDINMTLAIAGDAVAGVINLRHEGVFELSGTVDAVAIKEVDPFSQPRCGGGLSLPATLGSGGSRPATDFTPMSSGSMVTVDVMVVYTPQSRSAAGGTNQMLAAIANAVAQANAVFSNSAIQATYRLVHAAEVAYTELGNMHDDLFRLTDQADGFMEEVHCLRDRYGADLVSLVVNIGQYGGLAWILCDPSSFDPSRGFSVVARNQLGFYVLAHEFGHNFGCDHDYANRSECRAHGYSYGHRFINDGIYTNKTVMSYDPGFTVPHFSNPSVSWFGVPTGVSTNHNARTVMETMAMIASYRSPQLDPENPRFVMDCTADSPGYLLASPGMTIYAAARSNQLYVATWSTGVYPTDLGRNDHFIFVTDQLLPSATEPAPWSKSGMVAVASAKPYLAAESQTPFISWFNVSGASAVNKHPRNSGQMEGVFDLVQTFGYLPSMVYIAAAAYGTLDGGALVAQAPAGAGPNIDPHEFLAVPIAAILDRNLDGLFDRLDPDLDFMARDMEPTANGNVRVTWASVPGKKYQVESLPAPENQTPWIARQTVTGLPAAIFSSWTDSETPSTSAVYRIRHVP